LTDRGPADTIRAALAERFGEDFSVDPDLAGLDELARLAARRVHRRFADRPIEPALLRLLVACALSAPSKSDLQQADVMVVADGAKRAVIFGLLPDMPWLAEAPVFLMFLANGRRLPRIAGMRAKPFPNDHLDLFFNATVDTALVLATFIRAAEAVGLGACPISLVRNHAVRISELLELPERIVPVAGLAVGWPAEAGRISPRLSIEVTLHTDRYDADGQDAGIDAYDRRRAAQQPFRRQRDPQRFGTAEFYGWSEDKARQYAEPQRGDFGAFVRAKGFCLD
jgi:nitroreductase/FMN reductase [NAD(P)H]